MAGHTELARDRRKITEVWFPHGDEDAEGYRVGSGDITRIEAYEDHGPGDWLPYLAVYVDDWIIARIPAWQVVVIYEREES